LKKSIVFLIVMLFYSQLPASNNGGYGGPFLRMGLGARSIALGKAGVAGPLDAYSAFNNPALLGSMEGKMVGISYSFLALDRHYSYLSFSMKVPPEGGVSLGWIECGDDNLKSTNSIGEITGDINNSMNAFYFAFARQFSPRLAIGLAFKVVLMYINDGTEEFDYSAKGVGIDLGILYKICNNIWLGGQIKDMKAKFKANTSKIFEHGGTTKDKFPVTKKLGVFGHTPLQWLRIAYDFEWSDKDAYWHHFGFEAITRKNLALRIGYDYNDDSQTLTFGAGMDFQFMNRFDTYLDYVFLPSVAFDEGSSHIFSWQIKF
jgi:hypothetical protein